MSVRRFIPCRGGGPALQDLVAGQIDMMFDQAGNSIPQIQAGKIKAFAVTAKQRMKTSRTSRPSTRRAPRSLHRGLARALGSQGTPEEVAARLTAAILEALADPQVREKFTGLGQEISEPAQQTPQALRAYW